MRSVLIGSVLFLLGVAETADKKLDGTLFNGKDLTGWTFRGGEKGRAKSKWEVVGGVRTREAMNKQLDADKGTGILLNGGDGRGIDLLTEATHGDCELHLEFNVPKDSNSGVYFL